MTQLDLFRDHPRTRLDRVHDRGRIWQAYRECLTLDEARASLPDVPEAELRETWPAVCPAVPDSSLDRRHVMEAVQAMGAERALEWFAEGCDDLPWLRATVAEFAR